MRLDKNPRLDGQKKLGRGVGGGAAPSTAAAGGNNATMTAPGGEGKEEKKEDKMRYFGTIRVKLINRLGRIGF